MENLSQSSGVVVLPHTLEPANFASTQQDECWVYDNNAPETRTLDGWLGSFFESRERDFEILFTRLVIAVAEEMKVEIPSEMIDSITSDDLDDMTQFLPQETLCRLWHEKVLCQ